jgi:phosphoribosylpyrophosphate synthetase
VFWLGNPLSKATQLQGTSSVTWQQSGNDKLCRLLFFIDALKDAAAARVTAVTPYLAYARKDQKSQQ